MIEEIKVTTFDVIVIGSGSGVIMPLLPTVTTTPDLRAPRPDRGNPESIWRASDLITATVVRVDSKPDLLEKVEAIRVDGTPSLKPRGTGDRFWIHR